MANFTNRGTKKKPSWQYRVYVGQDPVTDKPKYVSKSGFTKKEYAEQAAAIVENQYRKGLYIGPVQTTLQELVDEWLKYYGQKNKPSSVKIMYGRCKKFIAFMDNSKVQHVSEYHCQTFINEMANKYSHNTVKLYYIALKMLFQYAKEKMKLINESPMINVELPKSQQTVEEIEKIDIGNNYFEKDELQEFLECAKIRGLDNDYSIFTLMAYTGLRSGEARALKWSDIDTKAGTLRVTKTLYHENNNRFKFSHLPPKTKKSIRTLSIDPFIIEVLEQHKQDQNIIKKDNAPVYNDYGYIFAENDGLPLTLNKLNDRMKRLLNRTTIDHELTTHAFRHTHTSLLIEANVHIKEIQERLGHSSITTTMDIYAQITKDVKRTASDQFSALMKDMSKELKRY